MKKIIHWAITSSGSIRGDTDGEPIDRGIHTSPVVSRDGNIVTTCSGSRYELIDPPHPFMTDPETLRQHWNGATSPLDAVDKFMQKREPTQ
jgi:hypothetical protein